MKDLLTNIHDQFYAKDNSDVKDILKQIQSNVLLGVKVAFSGIITVDRPPQEHPI